MIKRIMFHYRTKDAGFKVEHVDLEIEPFSEIRTCIRELWLENHPDIKYFYVSVFVQQPNRLFVMIKDCYQM